MSHSIISDSLDGTEVSPPDYGFLQRARPAGRVFVVGDIHGCLHPLKSLLDHWERKCSLSTDDLVVFVGDYIDRGPDSMGVVEHLLSFSKRFPDTIFLRGNHEEMLLDFLHLGGDHGEVFLRNGGIKTIESYGIDTESGVVDGLEVSPVVQASDLPKTHIDFYTGLHRYVVIEDVVVVHAGLNPLRDLYFQRDEDIYWIRDDFISNVHFFDKTVVFGHTPFKDITFDYPYKIAIDTGAVFENVLSGVELTRGEVFQVASGSKKVRRYTFQEKGFEGEWSWPSLHPARAEE